MYVFEIIEIVLHYTALSLRVLVDFVLQDDRKKSDTVARDIKNLQEMFKEASHSHIEQLVREHGFHTALDSLLVETEPKTSEVADVHHVSICVCDVCVCVICL